MTLALMKLSLSRLMWMKFDPAARALITVSSRRLCFASHAVRSLLLLLHLTLHVFPGLDGRGRDQPCRGRDDEARSIGVRSVPEWRAVCRIKRTLSPALFLSACMMNEVVRMLFVGRPSHHLLAVIAFPPSSSFR